MKIIIGLFTFLFILSTHTLAQDQEIDSAEDEKKTEIAVIRWADSVFYMHKEYKFDHFHAFYTEDYFIQVMRLRMYKERVEHLEEKKEKGRYQKSDAEYDKEYKTLNDAYTKVQADVDVFEFRVSHFETHFWSNIQTNDGITVYYEYIVKLDNDFRIVEANINSSIGAKSDKTKPMYKKGTGPVKKK